MKQPVVLVVMDGIGWTDQDHGNAVLHACKPHLDLLMSQYPHTTIRASGTAVGLPTDKDMGNSEVGHNALGCGQIYSQGAKLVQEAIDSGKIFQSQAWREAVAYAKEHHGKMHFIGLLSDGNVHSHIQHLLALLEQTKKEGLPEVRVHILLDGRDVPETSALQYVDQLEEKLQELNDGHYHACIASGGGRMTITMDRYEAEWAMVERGWKVHVEGEGRQFASAREAIETYRKEGNYTDQFLPGFVIARDGKPVGTIDDGDSVIFFNFRGDRALEISRAFEEENFQGFVQKKRPKVYYAGMLQYDGDLKIPKHFLVEPPHITHTLSEYLISKQISSYACSETQKYGHVTYFWNGNRNEKFDEKLETWEEIPSDVVPFEQRPWMKAAEITDKMIEAMASGKYQFLRCNYPNGDMVGHTGNYQATIIAVESVDLMLGRLMQAAEQYGYTLMVLADHGNSDEMLDAKGKPKTSHSLARVPFALYNAPAGTQVKEGDFGLSNVAATVVQLLGFAKPGEWDPSLIEDHG